MPNFDLFLKICTTCKGSVTLRANEHRDGYNSTEEQIQDLKRENENYASAFPGGEETVTRCLEKDTILTLEFYPNLLGGFHLLQHWDLEVLLKEACRILEIPLLE